MLAADRDIGDETGDTAAALFRRFAVSAVSLRQFALEAIISSNISFILRIILNLYIQIQIFESCHSNESKSANSKL